MEQKTQEQIIKEQKEEIAALKKKLSDRDPAFNGNLLKRSDSKFNELSKNIGEAIHRCVGQELFYIIQGKKMNFYYESSLYGNSHYRVSFSIEDERSIKDKIADLEMKKFQESLDNFAWAVNNQQG